MKITKLLQDVNNKEMVDDFKNQLRTCFLQECAEYNDEHDNFFCVNYAGIYVINDNNDFDIELTRYGIEYSEYVVDRYVSKKLNYNASEDEFNSSIISKNMIYSDLSVLERLRARYRHFLE